MTVGVVGADAGEVPDGRERVGVSKLYLYGCEGYASVVQISDVGVAEAVAVDAFAEVGASDDAGQGDSQVAGIERCAGLSGLGCDMGAEDRGRPAADVSSRQYRQPPQQGQLHREPPAWRCIVGRPFRASRSGLSGGNLLLRERDTIGPYRRASGARSTCISCAYRWRRCGRCLALNGR